MTETKELNETPIHCIQKCNYCKTITHECQNENCPEPAHAVCSNELCQAKLLIEYYQGQIEELKEIQKDELLTLKEKLSRQSQIIDTYRILMLKPEDASALVNKGAMNSHIMKIYCSANRPFWTTLAEKEPDVVSEWIEGFHTVYQSLLSILHAKGLKVEIRKQLIEKTQAKLNSPASQTQTQTPAKAKSPQSGTPEWVKTQPNGKVVYQIMKRLKCTKEQAEANLTKMMN